MTKFIPILLVFIGEALAIYAETFGIKQAIFSLGFWKIFAVMCISGLLLVLGYILGFKAFGNLWVITVVSLTTLLIVEPLILVIFLHQTPAVGSFVGLILGVIGLLFSIFY